MPGDRARRPKAQELERHRERIKAWLEQPEPLRLVRIHELLVRDGLQASYTTLRRNAHKEFGWRERQPTVLVDDPPPGEEAQVGFGMMGSHLDPSCWRSVVP